MKRNQSSHPTTDKKISKSVSKNEDLKLPDIHNPNLPPMVRIPPRKILKKRKVGKVGSFMQRHSIDLIGGSPKNKLKEEYYRKKSLNERKLEKGGRFTKKLIVFKRKKQGSRKQPNQSKNMPGWNESTILGQINNGN
jgi:hypothetical protein